MHDPTSTPSTIKPRLRDPRAVNAERLQHLAYCVADWISVIEIRSRAALVFEHGTAWLDTRYMTDPRTSGIEPRIADRLVEYAIAVGLVGQHPEHPHLVQIIK